MSSLPKTIACALSVAFILSCTMDVDDASSPSEGSEQTGPLDEWQGIWDFDWQVTGGGCPSLFTSDTRFVKVRWVGAGQLMFIYDDDWDGEFDDSTYLVGYPGGNSVSLQGDYVANEQQYHVNGTLTQMDVDYLTGTFYRDIVGSCTEMQTVEAFRISYQAFVSEDTAARAQLLFHDDLDGSLESVSIRSKLIPERAMLVDTSLGGRILINVPAGAIKVSTEGSGGLPLELREGELREIYLSSLITQR